jgi:hypothetical protein
MLVDYHPTILFVTCGKITPVPERNPGRPEKSFPDPARVYD